MRIRKHAKLAALMLDGGATTSSSAADPYPYATTRVQHTCQLNQSPWDVISFPPDSASSPYQVDGDGSFTANGSLGDSLGAVESVASLKISMDRDDKNATKKKIVENKIENEEEEELKNGIFLCCKTDGKGWQCKNEALRGYSLCEHHLVQLRTYSSLAHPSGKKTEKSAAGIRRRPRPKRATTAANPYEFYYYSGFGPRWGKKRGTRAEPSNTAGDEVEEGITETTPFLSSQIDKEEFDYIDDDEGEDEGGEGEGSGEFGKKRVRKPIKARSLKSLM